MSGVGTARLAGAPARPMRGEPVLRIRGLSCAFGSTQALADVSLDLHAGEVVALLGKNGAGKSTLIKIIAGVYRPTAGEVYVDGAPLDHPGQTRHGHGAKIAFVHQDLGLILPMTVAENIAQVAGYATRGGVISWARQRRAARAALERWDFDIDPDAPVATLDPAERALVAITRALATEAKVIVFDEPTAALPQHDVEILFTAIERLREAGVAVLYVTHRLSEVSRLADRVVILRDARRVLDVPVSQVALSEMVDAIVGETVGTFDSDYRPEGSDVVLAMDGVCGPGVEEVSLAVRRGEIVALVGLVSSGQRTVGQLVGGVCRAHAGTMVVAGQRYAPASPREALENGVAYLPASRQECGFFGFDTSTNFWLRRSELTRLDVRRERRDAGDIFAAWGIVPADPRVPLAALSGGNQQRVLLSKWVENDPVLLVVDEPAAGVDVGARQALYGRLDRVARAGVPLLVISSDAEEVAQVAHRALVFDDGRIVAELSHELLTVERITLECSRASARERPSAGE